MLPTCLSLLLLLFARLSLANAQQASTDGTTACCAMSATTLSSIAAEDPDCPISFSDILTKKCQLCQTAGTCRLNNRCICAEAFVSSPTRRSQCDNSFGSTWPTSIPEEDRDWRSCQPTVKPPPPNATSCCAMTEPDLQALRGFSPDCPSSSHDFQLAKKCDRCPPGLCRIDDECICPDQFLDRTTLHSDCADSFTVSWPQSVGKEDRATRSCRAVPPPKSTHLSCCSLTGKQINDMIGTSDRCPDSSLVSLSSECGICPSGMCRFDKSCYCPTRFLASSVKDLCERTFGVAWPESIGKTDPDIAGCGSETSAPPTTSEQSSSDSSSTTDSTSVSQENSTNVENKIPGNSGTSDSSAGSDAPTVVNTEPRLTTLEIVGIVAGVVSAIVAVIGTAVGLSRRRRKNHEEEPTFDERFG